MSKHHHISTNHFVNDLVFIVYLLISISVYVRYFFFQVMMVYVMFAVNGDEYIGLCK